MMLQLLALLSLLLLSSTYVADARSKAFPPGWNGKARTPPMGWRSWNSFGPEINRTIVEECMHAITAKSWNVHGQANGPVSLADLGYVDFGIDEGWESCDHQAAAPGGMQHDVTGKPLTNMTRFPDLAGLVKEGHSMGLSMGWYLAGCACGETTELERNYAGDVGTLHALGFDGAKFDNCGAMKNLTLYAELMAATGKNYTTESCHWGHCWDQDGDPDASGCPTADWCPFNLFRTSGDVAKAAGSWLHNLQTTIKFRDPVAPLSVPGCWAYPDMMEVGMVDEPAGSVDLHWNRAHFGAWAISSSPLIIGADLTDTALMRKIAPIITNTEAIAINQAWAGHPGRLLGGMGYEGKYPVVQDCQNSDETQRGWAWDEASGTVKGPGDLCLDNRTIGDYDGHPIPSSENNQFQLRACDGSDFQRFVLNTSLAPIHTPRGTGSAWGVLQSNQIPVGSSSRQFPGACPAGLDKTGSCCVKTNGWWDWNVGPAACSGGDWNSMLQFVDGRVEMRPDPEAAVRRCWSVWDFPVGGYKVQYWTKPVDRVAGSAALLVINSSPSAAQTVTIDLKDVIGSANTANLAVFSGSGGKQGRAVRVRDIWAHTDNGTVTNTFTTTVGPADSVFVLLTPVADE